MGPEDMSGCILDRRLPTEPPTVDECLAALQAAEDVAAWGWAGPWPWTTAGDLTSEQQRAIDAGRREYYLRTTRMPEAT